MIFCLRVLKKLIYLIGILFSPVLSIAAVPQFLEYQVQCANSSCYVDGNIYIGSGGWAQATFKPDQDIDIEIRLDSDTGTLVYQKSGYFKNNGLILVSFFADTFKIQEGTYPPDVVNNPLSPDIGTQFLFIIRNTSAEGASKFQTVILDTTSPDAPTGVSANSEDTAVTVRWTKSGSTDIKYYNVYFRKETESNFILLGSTVSENETSFRVTELENNIVYEFGISAVDRVLNEGAIKTTQDDGQPVKATPAAIIGLHGLSPDEQGGCFIATAVYNGSAGPEVSILREFRDRHLMKNPLGRMFVKFYYEFSPGVAMFIKNHGIVKPVARFILNPIVFIAFIGLNSIPGAVILVIAAVSLFFVLMKEFRRKQLLKSSL